MGITPKLIRILATLLVLAVVAVPSVVWAHEGHAHHAAVKATASPPDVSTPKAVAITQSVARVVVAVSAATPPPNAGIVPTTDCASHCCGGATGMTCCGAILAPDACCYPFLNTSVRFVIPNIPPQAGLSPEALPKPPKSFA